MNTWKLPKEQKEQIVEKLRDYFAERRSEEIGQLEAELMLDDLIALIGPHVYNHAIGDARKLVGDKMSAMEDELYAIEKPIRFQRRNE